LFEETFVQQANVGLFEANCIEDVDNSVGNDVAGHDLLHRQLSLFVGAFLLD